jgi:CheY-like chemotaxis protein
MADPGDPHLVEKGHGRMAKKSCSILVVDTDQANARLIGQTLKAIGHSVFTARDGAHALSILEFRAFDVLVIDVMASRIEDVDLIAWAAVLLPRPRILAMGNPATRAVERVLNSRGANLFLPKPLDLERLKEFVSPIRSRSSFTGTVEGVDIVEYVQFVMLGGGKTILEVTSSLGTQGRIFLSDGMAVHAVCGILQGEQALYRCLRFKEGTFRHLPWEGPEKVTINKPGEFLLMEAVRKRDEAWGEGSDAGD